MKVSRLALVTTTVGFLILQGCASSDDATSADQKRSQAFNNPEPPTFVDNAVNADQHFSDSVDATSPTQLTVTNAGNETTLAKIEVGTILAGNRSSQNSDPTTSPNAFGFLRRVTAIQKNGASTVLQTTQAELDEWIKEGDLDFSNPRSIFTTTTELGTRTLHPLDEESGGGSGSASAKLDQEFDGDEKDAGNGVKVKPVIRLSNGTLQVNAKYDGYFKVRTIIGLPRSAQFKSLLTLDPVIGADLTVGVSVQGQGPIAIGTVNGITIASKSIDGPGVVIPIAAPIPLTVRFHPRVTCTLGASGEATATFNVTLRSHAAVGFQGDATVSGINTTDLSEQPTLTPTYQFKGGQIKEDVTVECGIYAVPEVLAFDAIGLSGEVGPFVDLNLNACLNANESTQTVDGGYEIDEQHGLALNFAARAQLPVVGIGKDFPLLTVHTAKSTPKYIVGDKDTCSLKTADTCNGRTDGFYCSVVDTYSGIYCKGGQVLNGLQCSGGTSQKCVSGTQTTINCQ